MSSCTWLGRQGRAGIAHSPGSSPQAPPLGCRAPPAPAACGPLVPRGPVCCKKGAHLVRDVQLGPGGHSLLHPRDSRVLQPPQEGAVGSADVIQYRLAVGAHHRTALHEGVGQLQLRETRMEGGVGGVKKEGGSREPPCSARGGSVCLGKACTHLDQVVGLFLSHEVVAQEGTWRPGQGLHPGLLGVLCSARQR